MRQEHLTPDGWKPCNAILKKCKYERRSISNKASAFIDSAVEDVQKGKPDAIKHLLDKLDKLFSPVKKSNSKLEPKQEAPVEIEPTNIYESLLEEDEYDEDKDLNRVIQGGNGQFKIDCRSVFHHDSRITHKFGDFIKNETTAEMLHQADPKKEYQLRSCAVLAKRLYENEHAVEYYIFKTEEFPVIGTHHFVKLKDGTYADSLGIWTEEALLSKWKEKDPTVELSLCDPKSPEITESDILVTKDIFPEMTEDVTKEITKLIDKHMKGKTL